MKASYRRIMLIAALLLSMLATTVLTPLPARAATTSALDFRNQMRKLWEDHITWTRLTIVGVFTDDPETPATVQRLLQNQVDLGDAIKPYYGAAAGDQLTALLHDHITGAADLLKAAKAGDQAAIKAASDKWYANADEIATFLHNANPQNWPLDTLKAMMKTHLDTTLAEALANLKKDYPADVAAYEAVHLHILMMADALSTGIIAQFPDRFAPPPPDAQVNFRLTMRKLWEDHITWTRLTIVGVFTDDPETPATVQRLLQNQVDLGDAIKPYYGAAAGDQLTALLHDHITGAADLLKAAKAGDQAAIKAASDKWYANADEIATFLHNANPQNWPLDTLKAMMKTHLDTTLAEALANLKKDYPADVAAYEAVHLHILMMADALSTGIIAQFPDRFGGTTMPAGQPGRPLPATGVEAGTVLFPETGFSMGGTFLSYWRANGGLPIFGYPINTEQPIDGRIVQWTERARLELHPENPIPYNVLLGRLGAEALEQRGIDWRSFPTVDSAPQGCRYFAETRHALCGAFLSYWRTHGLEFDRRSGANSAESLALFGYPLSEPQMEQGADGTMYLTQWFERGRFEFHPNNPRPYQLLLGRLGAEVLGR